MSERTRPKQGPHRFKPGQSGNPDGRPRGSRNKATVMAQALLDGQAEELARVAVEKALEGDMVALRLCMERLVPPSKEAPLPEPVELPKRLTAKNLPKAVEAIIKAVAEGTIAPGQGEKVVSMLQGHSKILELAEIEARITELERRAEEVKNERS